MFKEVVIQFQTVASGSAETYCIVLTEVSYTLSIPIN